MLFSLSSKPKVVVPPRYPFFIKQNRVCEIQTATDMEPPLFTTLKVTSPIKHPEKTVLMYACSDKPTFGKGGGGFEFYLFADGKVQIWNADGTKYTGHTGQSDNVSDLPPYGNIMYPRWLIKFQALYAPNTPGAHYAHGWLAGVKADSLEWVTGLWKFDCYQPNFYDQTNRTIFKFPFKIYVGALPRKNFSGWHGIDRVTIDSVTTGE